MGTPLLTSPAEGDQELEVGLGLRLGEDLFSGDDVHRDGLLAHDVLGNC